LTDTILTVNDWRFFRVQREVKLKALIDGMQLLVAAVPLDLPVAVPDATEGFVHRGDARDGAVGALGMVKLASIKIAQREMRQVEILHFPSAGLCGIAAYSLAEESQFESETVAVRGFDISGVVPPFGLKIRMIEMVAWKFVVVPRQGGAVLRRKRLQEEKRGDEAR
jgi:hypothetical protein